MGGIDIPLADSGAQEWSRYSISEETNVLFNYIMPDFNCIILDSNDAIKNCHVKTTSVANIENCKLKSATIYDMIFIYWSYYIIMVEMH